MDNSVDVRRKYLGSSDIPVVMGVSKYKSKRELWLEKTGQRLPEDISNRDAVLLGTELESVIREKVERELGQKFPPQTFLDGYRRAQLDGFNDESKVMVEIKTVGADRFADAENKVIWDDHKFQVQWQLMLSGAKKAIYVAFLVKEDKMTTFEVLPDEAVWANMQLAADKFWGAVMNNTEPDEYLLSPDVKHYIKQWGVAKAMFDTAKARFEEVDEKLKELLEESKIRGVEWSGFKAITVERQGNIAYKNIPELQGIDVEQYRGKPVKFYKFSLEGEV